MFVGISEDERGNSKGNDRPEAGDMVTICDPRNRAFQSTFIVTHAVGHGFAQGVFRKQI